MNHNATTQCSSILGERRGSEKMSIAFLVPTLEETPMHKRTTSASSSMVTADEQHIEVELQIDTSSTPTPTSVSLLSCVGASETAIDQEDPDPGSFDPCSPSPFRSNAKRSPRLSRPSYSEEQKFFIMFARIVQEKCWCDIEDDFSTVFGQRTKGGLTSVYYRIRKLWGLEEVLKSSAMTYGAEKRVIDQRAVNFSQEFLVTIGYLE